MINGIRVTAVIISVCMSVAAAGQPEIYSVANAHSHNDYENAVPFYTAYQVGFGSIEADIFLEHGQLYVAHDTTELKKHRTLEEYYLHPLVMGVQEHNGHPYLNSSAVLQMLIDVKTDSIETLDALIKTLVRFPSLIGNPAIKWVITGNRPAPGLFTHYPAYIFFDGDPAKEYNQEALTRVAMLSADFKNYSGWNGVGEISPSGKAMLVKVVSKGQRLRKPVRFWDAPDNVNAWRQLEQMGVGYINTDHIRELAAFFQQH